MPLPRQQPSRHKPELCKLYQQDNVQYFGGKLRTDVVVEYAPVGVLGEMAETHECGTHLCIDIDPTYNLAGRVVGMTLLHEMVHVELWGKDFDHGPGFQAEMRRLATCGAFDDLW